MIAILIAYAVIGFLLARHFYKRYVQDNEQGELVDSVNVALIAILWPAYLIALVMIFLFNLNDDDSNWH